MLQLTDLTAGLKRRLTVEKNIQLMGNLLGVFGNLMDEMIDNVLRLSDLENYRQSRYYELSKGMRQRLSFSIAMIVCKLRHPDILLLDEVLPEEVDEKFYILAKNKLWQVVEETPVVIIASHKL